MLVDILIDREITGVTVTYISDAYGKALETAFADAFKAHGGRVAISISHGDGNDDYFDEVGALATAGVEHLVVLGVLDQGGLGIVRTASDTGAFEKFVLGDGMIGDQLIATIDEELDGILATVPDSVATIKSDTPPPADQAPELEKILLGELARAVEIIKSAEPIELESSTAVPFVRLARPTAPIVNLNSAMASSSRSKSVSHQNF